MKKKFLVGLLAGMLVVLLMGAWANAAEKITFGFTHIWPATHFTHVHQFTRYFKMVEKATGGKYALDVKFYPVGTLLGGGEQYYDGVVKGIADCGTSSLIYTPGRFPVMITLYQPGAAPPENSDAAARTGWEFYKKWKPKEFDDARVLYFYATGPAWLHTKKPITSLAQVKGLKVRTTADNVEVFRLLGAEPTSMVMGEVYLAAKKGIIDSLISPLETLEAWKHAEIFDCSTFVPHFYSSFFWVSMNWNKWNALPKDLQAAFDAVADDAVKEAGAIWQHFQMTAVNFAKAKPGGHQFIRLPETEWTRVKEMTKPIRDKWVSDLNAKGLPGKEIMESAGAIMEKNNKLKYEPWNP